MVQIKKGTKKCVIKWELEVKYQKNCVGKKWLEKRNTEVDRLKQMIKNS